MIVELDDVSSFWMMGSFWLHGGGGIGDGHRIRMEDREDQGMCVLGRAAREGCILILSTASSLLIDRML